MNESELDAIILPIFQRVTEEFSDFVLKEIPDSRSLFQTVAFVPKSVLSYEIWADDYFKFVNEGVEGLGGNTAFREVFKGSRFKFRKMSVSSGFAQAINQWKGIPFPQAYAVAMSIKIHGIKKKELTDKFFTKEKLELIATELIEKLKLPLTVQFKLNT